MDSHLHSATEIDSALASRDESTEGVDGATQRRAWEAPALKRVWEAPALTSIPLDAAETGINFGPEILILLS